MESKDFESGSSGRSSPDDGSHGQPLGKPSSPPIQATASAGEAGAAGATKGCCKDDDPESCEDGEFRGAGREKEALKSLQYEIQKRAKELEKVKKDISGLLKNVNDLMTMPSEMSAVHDNQKLFKGTLAYIEKDVMAVRNQLGKLMLSPTSTDSGVFAGVFSKIQELEGSLASLRLYGKQINKRLVGLETSHSGVFLWKIANYVEKKRDAMNTNVKSIYSPPFFTSQYGYKLCGRVFLMGDGVGKGTHISLFLTIMKGPFDAVLPWPFKERITFQLVNQDDPVNKSIVEAFRPDPASSSFKRPTSKKNIGAGCPLFAKIQMVEDRMSGFLRDNTIYLKIVCQTSDVPKIN